MATVQETWVHLMDLGVTLGLIDSLFPREEYPEELRESWSERLDAINRELAMARNEAIEFGSHFDRD